MSYLEITGIATAVPSAATAGVPLRIGSVIGKPEQGFGDGELENLVLLYRATVTAGQTATMDFLRIWCYFETGTDDWYPVGPAVAGGTDADRGKLNNLVGLAEIVADKLHLAQVINLPGGATRIYLQEGTSGGSGYASTAFLVKGR